MSKSKSRKRRNRYKIQPLGFVALGLILLIIIALVVFLVVRPKADGSSSGNAGADILAEATDMPEETEVLETPEPTPEPTPVPTPEPTPRSATIRSLGEIAIQDNLLKAARGDDGSYDFSEMFSYISESMGGADYTIADVEGSLGGSSDPAGDERLLTPPSLIQTLKDCGVDMLNLANDHALDGGFSDLQAAIANCQEAGMDYVGAATSATERDTAKVVDINGIKVGFVAYTESLNGMEKNAEADALEYGINYAAKSDAKADIQACRDAGADVIVACVSWGEMLNREPTKNQKKIAQVLVGYGVDVIIGYNPHVLQPAMWLEMGKSSSATGKTLCILSNGNFLSDSRAKYSDSGIIFQFTIQEREDLSGFDIVSPQYIPTYVWRMEEGDYDYRTLAVGQWLDTAPEGMNYTQESRMREVWAEAQSIMGTDVATITKE